MNKKIQMQNNLGLHLIKNCLYGLPGSVFFFTSSQPMMKWSYIRKNINIIPLTYIHIYMKINK